MKKTLLLLTLSSLLSLNMSHAASLGTATVILRNNTVDSSRLGEIANVSVQGMSMNLAAQQQTSVTVTAGTNFIIKVNNIIMANKKIDRKYFLGCFVGVNTILQANQTETMTITANSNPVHNKSIFTCTLTK
jgi:hypothetical protein